MLIAMLSLLTGSVRMGTGAIGLGAQAFALLVAGSVWMAGSIILGMLTLIARGRRVVIEDGE